MTSLKLKALISILMNAELLTKITREADHVSIVGRADGGIVSTVEGNPDDSCRENHYAVGHYEIYGYGVPHY